MTALYLTSDSSYPKAQKSFQSLEITLWSKQHCITEGEQKDTAVLLRNESQWQGSSAPGQMPELWADREIHDAPSTEKGKQRKHEKKRKHGVLH